MNDDLSKLYKESRKSSPRELDEAVLAAAREHAQPYSKRKKAPFVWMPAAAFSMVFLVGILFVLNMDSQKMSDDIEIFADGYDFDSETPVQLNTDDVVREMKMAPSAALSEMEAQLADSISRAQSAGNLNAMADAIAEPPIAPGSTLPNKSFDLPESNSSPSDIAELMSEPVLADEPLPRSVDQASDTELDFFPIVENEINLAKSSSLSLQAESALEEIIDESSPGLVSLTELIPDLVLDLRYQSSNNFVGEPIDAYQAEKALISAAAADALARVQARARQQGLGLKVFDAYRPQSAVDHFVRWAEDLDDQKTKQTYYPNVDKSELFAQGYIAEKSGHSRASTVDLTLVRLSDGQELDMGSPFDFFDPISRALSTEVDLQAQDNRRLLRSLMMEQGFVPYEAEWWHFTLGNEPYPEQYFDIPIN